MDGIDERLIALEIKITYQEDTIEQLHQVLVRQQEQLERLARRLEELEDRQVAGSGYDPNAPQEPPPHY